MEFERECDMLAPVRRWLGSQGLMTKSEFANPWGVCDVVGCALDERRVTKRLALRQHRAIGPPLRVVLLERIPDQDTGRAVSLRKLQDDHAGLIDGETVATEVDRLVSARFVQVTPKGSLQKVNGWAPLHKRLVTVELKLTRVLEAFRQAVMNRELTSESYAAFPLSIARRISDSKGIQRFKHAGIGVIGVTPGKCKVLVRPRDLRHRADTVAQTHCVERFWRTRVRGS